jgi:urease accessory protein
MRVCWRWRRWYWADTLRCEGDFDAAGGGWGFGDARALATLVYAGSDAAAHLDLARATIEGSRGGATTFDGMLIVRLIDADAAALRRQVARVSGALRAAVFGLSPVLPTVFHC